MLSRPHIEHILVPVDLSEGFEPSLSYGVFLADRFGASVEVLHVVEGSRGIAMIVPGASAESDLTLAAERAWRRIDVAVAALNREGGSKIRVDVRVGGVATCILERAQAGDCDLIVMGTHGRRGLQRMLLGSVAEEVIRTAPCPVVTLHLPGGDVEQPLVAPR